MGIISDKGKKTLTSFSDWVSANSPDIPAEVVYPPKKDDHGHGHDDHGHDDHGGHGHDDHGHDDHCEAAHADETHAHEEVLHEEPLKEASHEEPAAEAPQEEPAAEAVEAPAAEAPPPIEAPEPAKPEEPVSEEAKLCAEVGAIERSYRAVATICGIMLALILVVTVALLPKFGMANNPTVNEVSRRYLEEGIKDTGAVNTVAGMILDYRAFDTLGESIVLFTATITVIFLLQQSRRKDNEGKIGSTEANLSGVRSLPAKVIIRIALPFSLLYGIYVVINGHLSPGGGFSGGTIIGASLILSHLAFGERFTKRFATVDGCSKVMVAALLVYMGLKTYSVYTGANGIESIIPLGTPGSILSAGLIFPLNICVGLVVSCTMFTLYSLFTDWKIS
ncbi:MAG: hypothetical protein IKI49_00310 [Oscillospiraceae bacterium]|nr:hypothetical protein [Oscillospiraceae bacterium]